MKRLCFDTESTYWKRPDSEVGTPEEHREHFRRLNIRFKLHCAVVYDSSTSKYIEFLHSETDALVNLLSNADELISHSGKWVDLLVLEHHCGAERIESLQRVRHHDLFEFFPAKGLDLLSRRFIPDQESEMRRNFENRVRLAREPAPGLDGRVFEKIAKARFDVERTWAIFEAQHGNPENSGA